MIRTISFYAKCSDLFSATLNIDGKQYEIEGYPPCGLGIGGGDDIEMEIDLDTGQILNWTPPTDDAIAEAIGEDDEEDEDDDQRDDFDWDNYERNM